MPILSTIGRRAWSQRLFVWLVYGSLSFFGVTMAVPFLITLTSSGSNTFDYDRFSILPRSLWSKDDRFMKALPTFIEGFPNWHQVLRYHFAEVSPQWTSWRFIGQDRAGVDRVASAYLGEDPAAVEARKRMAADYAEFALGYPLEDCVASYSNEIASDFVAVRYEKLWKEKDPEAARDAGMIEREEESLKLLEENWGILIPNYLAIRFEREKRAPLSQQSWAPSPGPKQKDFQRLCYALQHGFGTPGVLASWAEFLKKKGYSGEAAEALSPLPETATEEQAALWLEFARTNAPASPLIPFPMKLVWLEYLATDEARKTLHFNDTELFNIAAYNRLAGTNYSTLEATPFPLPSEGFEPLRPAWVKFVENRYPLRLTRLELTPALQARYEAFLQKRFGTPGNLNKLAGTNHAAWKDFILEARLPENASQSALGIREVWLDFVKTLPVGERRVSSSEAAYQDLLRQKYGSLPEVNRIYGWNLKYWEEARPPFDQAFTQTYLNHAAAFAWHPLWFNYHTIGKFLLRQGNAIPVTLWLIVLSIAITLTINPIAGYALSRFNLKGKDKIILFCLATAAFPAMVSAIPGYLLMRDLGLLNTFFALVLPGAANGMAIFILKGFYDSLPPELFEAATIDGAKEWQIFVYVTLPMIKPILAINALNAFMHAYGSWEWALIICQEKKMWTLSVWLYQASQWWANTPWVTTAGFVIASIPILMVFLFCQKIIMRGIIVPSMK